MELYGRAGIYGVSGSLLFAGQVVGVQDYVLKDGLFSKPFQFQPLTDSHNEIIGGAVSQKSIAFQLDVIPIGGTSSNNTVAKAKLALDAVPSSVVVIQLLGTDMASMSGSFNYLGGATAKLTSDGYGVISLPAIRYTATVSDPATLATVVVDSYND